MLKIRDLHTSYGAVQVLRGVTFEVSQGGIVTLLGGNGSGKSTTLKSIMGFAPAHAGSIQYRGEEIRTLKPEQIVPKGIAIVPQGRRLFAPLTVQENLRLGAFARRNNREVRNDFQRVLEHFPEMRLWLGRRGNELSVGQQQLVAFGRGLMSRPQLLLLDEPSAGLAPMLVAKLAEIIRQIASAGTTILLVEQNVHLALSLASFGYVLRDGRIALAGSSERLQNNEDVTRQYLGGDAAEE
jgi:branched-chain amino acid transport system ATP-binding protein